MQKYNYLEIKMLTHEQVDTWARHYESTKEEVNDSFPKSQASLHGWNATWVGIEWCIGIEFIPNTENCIYGGKKLVKGIISSGNMRTVVS